MSTTRTILVVDDDAEARRQTALTLAAEGYETLTAANGVEALEVAERSPPDALLTDILMPDMDGFQLCREWRKRPGLASRPVVLYSATYLDPIVRDFGLSLGAARYLTKPQPGAVLADTLEQVLREGAPEAARLEPDDDETEYLQSYNQVLIHKLEDKLIELERANRMLEQRVAERTADLAAANEQLQHNIAALQRANDQLQELNRQKDRFVGLAVHDLRGPLSNIHSYAQLLGSNKTGPLTPQQRTIVDKISNLSAFMFHAVGDMLDFTGLETSHLALKRRHIELGEVLLRAVEINRLLAATRNIIIDYTPAAAKLPVLADPDKIEQVFHQLLSNAIQYSPPNSSVEVTAGIDKKQVVVSVRDHGRGIEGAELARIFDPYFRTGAATSKDTESLGLGLTIARRIVKGHGGKIWAESIAGQGSTFHISLPVAAQAPDADERHAPAQDVI